MSKLYQQGDVLIFVVDSIPEGCKKKEDKILAEGEATGHHHVAVEDDVELFEKDGKLFMSAPKGTRVVHEEHKEITIPSGTFEVRKVKEWDYFAEEAKNVRD